MLFGDDYLPLVFPYGLSPSSSNIDEEIKKIQLAESLGADMVKDNTIGRKEWEKLFERVSEETNLCVGASATITAANMASDRTGECSNPTEDEYYQAFERLAEVCDAIEVFPTITEESIYLLEKSNRLNKTSVSRAGAIITRYMTRIPGKISENPFYSNFEWFLNFAKKKDITLILGNGYRAGCLADSMDDVQLYETGVMKEFSKKATDRGVKVIAGIFGHVDPSKKDKIENIRSQIDVPIGGLGPLVTDISLGYDHINAAIGIALLREYIDWVSLITPAEHIGLPNVNDVYDGMAAINTARHILDLMNGSTEAYKKDSMMAKSRTTLDWQGVVRSSINPYLNRLREVEKRTEKSFCDLCGEWCPLYNQIKNQVEKG